MNLTSPIPELLILLAVAITIVTVGITQSNKKKQKSNADKMQKTEHATEVAKNSKTSSSLLKSSWLKWLAAAAALIAVVWFVNSIAISPSNIFNQLRSLDQVGWTVVMMAIGVLLLLFGTIAPFLSSAFSNNERKEVAKDSRLFAIIFFGIAAFIVWPYIF